MGKHVTTNLNEWLNEASEGPNMIRIKTKFNVKNEGGDVILHVKDGKDFPWRIKSKDGKFILQQQFSARTYIKPTWTKKGEFSSVEEAIDKIIKSYNKSAKNPDMGWKEIK